MPLRRMAGPTTSTSVTPTDEPCLSYAIDDQLEASGSNRAGRTRSRTATLTGNTPLRPHYRMAACSGFAASAAPAPPPKAPFRSSPPPRSARLDSTIPLGHPNSFRPTPALNSQTDHPTPTAPLVLQHTAPGHDACAVAEQLSNTLLSYSHRDWDQSQRADPLCDATRRYIQLGRPKPVPRSLCDHLPSHTRPEIADITDLATKGRLLEGDDDTILLVWKPITVASAPNGLNRHRSGLPFDDPVRIYVPLLEIADITDLATKGRLLEGDDDTILLVWKPITVASAPNGLNSHRSGLPFDDPVRIYVPLLARPWIMHASHADASCHLGVTRTLQMLERFYWWVGMEVCTK